jgi:predicted DNA binding protein
MRYMNLAVSLPDPMLHPMQAFVRHEDAVEYEELRAANLFPDSDVEYELFYVVGDRERYRRTIEDVESVRSYNLTPVDDRSFYVWACQETREADLHWREAFLDRELMTVMPIHIDDRADMHMTLVGEGENLSALVETIPGIIDVTVEEVGEYDRRHGSLLGRLTERQFEAVRAAVSLGYYRTPKEATLADVGEALDCTAGTASTLLSKAENAIMCRLVERTGGAPATDRPRP